MSGSTRLAYQLISQLLYLVQERWLQGWVAAVKSVYQHDELLSIFLQDFKILAIQNYSLCLKLL